MENQPKHQTQTEANPTPAGLVALAVACFMFFALLTGQVGKGALPLMGCFLLGGFIIQFTVAKYDLKSGSASGGNTFLYFSAFFMFASGLEMFFKYFCADLDGRIDGWAWLALALIVIMWTPAFIKSPAILFVLVCFLDIAVPCIVINDLKLFDAETSKIFADIAGVCLLICGILAIYLSSAMILNTTFGKKILPNPAPFYKK